MSIGVSKTSDGALMVSGTMQLSGSSVDLRGLQADRPAADSVDVGTTYWSVDEPAAPGTVFVTDGSSWATLTVL